MVGWIVWLTAAAVLIVVEMLTLTFYLLWLAIGAVVACLISLIFPDLLTVQLLSGAFASLLLTIFTKPLTRRLGLGNKFQDSNDNLVGMEGIVIQAITPEKLGIVRIGRESWSATAKQPLEVNQLVIIINRGTTIIEVQKIGGEE